MAFHVTTRLGGSLVQVHTKFHDYSMSFILVLFFVMLEHDMDIGQVQVMEFPWHLLRNWRDSHRIWGHFRTKPNCRQKDMRKSVSHFLQELHFRHAQNNVDQH